MHFTRKVISGMSHFILRIRQFGARSMTLKRNLTLWHKKGHVSRKVWIP
jgi:hypothetical protein